MAGLQRKKAESVKVWYCRLYLWLGEHEVFQLTSAFLSAEDAAVSADVV